MSAQNTDGGPLGTEPTGHVPASTPQTRTYGRWYQHILKKQTYSNKEVQAYNSNESDSTWSVLPIQNAGHAALKDSDWIAIMQSSTAVRVLSLGVHTTAWQFRERQLSNQEIQSQTVPNQQVQIFVDNDRIAPGYEQNFYYEYATNNNYQYADLQDNDNDDTEILIQPWTWFNSSNQSIYERRDLNWWNTANVSLLNQTGTFDYEWKAEGHAKQWFHTSAPWQYQINPVQLDAMDNHAVGTYSAGLTGAPGARRYTTTGLYDQWDWGGITLNTGQQSCHYNNVNTVGVGILESDHSKKGTNKTAVWRDGHLGGEGGYGSGNYATNVYQGAYFNRVRDQLTHLPTPTRKPPPIILMRPTINDQDSQNVFWSFWCCYTCTLEFIPVNGATRWGAAEGVPLTANWSGAGNLMHWRTRPGDGPTGPQEPAAANNNTRGQYARGNDLVCDDIS